MSANDPNDQTAATTGTDDAVELRRQLDEYKARATSAETVAANERKGRILAERKHMTSEQRGVVSALDSAESQIATLENQAETLENRIAELTDLPGNGKEVAKLTRQMGEVTADLRDLAKRKTFLAAQVEKFAKGGDAPVSQGGERTVANGTPLSQFGPRTQAWIERHPKAFTDTEYLNKAIAAANAATSLEGLPDESDAYFSFIETKLGERQAAAPADDGTDIDPPVDLHTVAKPQSRAAGPGAMAAAMAPPTRQTPTGGTAPRRGNVSLSADEREVAVALGASRGLNEADAIVAYAEGKKFMAARNPQHFSTRH